VEEVKTRQQIAAEGTQRTIIETAGRLFLEHGYRETSINRIASEAGVAIQTVYNSVGSKRDLLSRVLDFAAAGERAPVPVAEFMHNQAERADDAGQIVAQLVEFWRTALPATASLFRVIREAAAVDVDAAALEQARARQRLHNYAHAAGLLAERGGLRKGLTLDQAAAAIFAIGHPETYRTLVVDGDWDIDQWARWAHSALESALLEP
jgi:AcrR family transcriptional regulator